MPITREDQKRIITEMCDRLKADLLEKAERIPEEWDGFELREWMAQSARYGVHNMGRGRLRACNNEILIRNL